MDQATSDADALTSWSVDTTIRDIRYGLRSLARSPGFTLAVLLTLALTIGANATVFSVMHAVMWKPLPYPSADRLVLVDADARGIRAAGLSGNEARDLRAEPDLFEALASIVRVDAHLTDGDYDRVPAASVTDDALPLLGAPPMTLGRPLDSARDGGVTGVVRAIVISHRLWQRRFDSDPAVIGRHVSVNNLDVEIVGVLPPGFRVFLPANTALPDVVDVWFPAGFEPNSRGRTQGTIARLAHGVSLDAARTRLAVLAKRFMTDHAADYADGPLSLMAAPLQDVLVADSRRPLWILAGAVFFVLLIGCVNVGNLMLVRARARAPEIAVRRALGATRSRLVRELFAEVVVVSVAGAIAGFAVAYGGVALVDWLRPMHLPRQSQVAITMPVAMYTALLVVAVSLVFGLVPAFSARAADEDAMRAGRARVQRAGMRRLQRGLVISEVALSIIPLVAAGLMLRTFMNLTSAPIGFEPEGLVTAKVAVSLRLNPDPKQRLQLHRDAFARVAGLPGVEAVSAASPLPFDEHQFTRSYGRETDAYPLPFRGTLQTVFPGYLAIAGVALVAGRDFTTDDLVNERPVVIVDRRIAEQLWPDGAVGKRLAVSRGRSSVPLEVIGVTNSVRMTRVRDDAMPHMFVPYHFYPLEMALVVKTAQAPAAIAPAIRRVVESLGTRRPVYDIRSMWSYVESSIGDTRFMMLVLIGFGAASLLLTGVGVYGTLAYLIAQRTQEFGIRMALGASAGRIVRTVLGEGALLCGAGAVIGLAGAAMLSSAIRGLLYDVAPFDVITLAGAAAAIAGVALIAAGQPAWRAARVDPATTLRLITF